MATELTRETLWQATSPVTNMEYRGLRLRNVTSATTPGIHELSPNRDILQGTEADFYVVESRSRIAAGGEKQWERMLAFPLSINGMAAYPTAEDSFLALLYSRTPGVTTQPK